MIHKDDITGAFSSENSSSELFLSEKKIIWVQIIFWLTALLYNVFFSSFLIWPKSLFSGLSSTLIAIIIIYGHSLYIFPILLNKKKYFLYIVAVIVFIIAIAFLKMKVSVFFFPEGKVASFIPFWPIYFYSLFATFAGVVVSATVKFTFDYFKITAKQQQLKNNQILAELKYLKMQVNPHFLFNTLNNLLYLTQEKSDIAPTIVEKLAQIMRYMLEKGNEEKTLLKTEIEFLNAYIELEKIRIPSVNIEFETEGMIETKIIPPLILLPLIENAFKHGIDKSKSDNYIFIKMTTEDNFLVLTTQNLIHKQYIKKSGIGLKNLKQRLELIYGDDYSLKQDESAGYFVSTVRIPYI